MGSYLVSQNSLGTPSLVSPLSSFPSRPSQNEHKDVQYMSNDKEDNRDNRCLPSTCLSGLRGSPVLPYIIPVAWATKRPLGDVKWF